MNHKNAYEFANGNLLVGLKMTEEEWEEWHSYEEDKERVLKEKANTKPRLEVYIKSESDTIPSDIIRLNDIEKNTIRKAKDQIRMRYPYLKRKDYTLYLILPSKINLL